MLTIILVHGIVFAALVVALLIWWHFASKERPWVPPIVVREVPPATSEVPYADRVCIHGVKEIGPVSGPNDAEFECEECVHRPFADEAEVRALYEKLSTWEPYYASDKMDAVRRNLAVEIAWRRREQAKADKYLPAIRAALTATSANQMRRILETAIRSKA